MTQHATLLNPDRGGDFRTVKSNYHKQSALNLLERQRKNYIATGILVEYTTPVPPPRQDAARRLHPSVLRP